ncbi:unnamed protein product, partial [Owenia fusiformis]
KGYGEIDLDENLEHMKDDEINTVTLDSIVEDEQEDEMEQKDALVGSTENINQYDGTKIKEDVHDDQTVDDSEGVIGDQDDCAFLEDTGTNNQGAYDERASCGVESRMGWVEEDSSGDDDFNEEIKDHDRTAVKEKSSEMVSQSKSDDLVQTKSSNISEDSQDADCSSGAIKDNVTLKVSSPEDQKDNTGNQACTIDQVCRPNSPNGSNALNQDGILIRKCSPKEECENVDNADNDEINEIMEKETP